MTMWLVRMLGKVTCADKTAAGSKASRSTDRRFKKRLTEDNFSGKRAARLAQGFSGTITLSELSGTRQPVAERESTYPAAAARTDATIRKRRPCIKLGMAAELRIGFGGPSLLGFCTGAHRNFSWRQVSNRVTDAGERQRFHAWNHPITNQESPSLYPAKPASGTKGILLVGTASY
jgi:hypothetical protein